MNSAIIYRGPSLLDGAPIVVVATGLQRGSDNAKTGAMIQTYILRSDVHPVDAVRSGADASICGDCPLRPSLAAPGAARCYVRKDQGPANVFRTALAGKYAELDPATVGALALAAGRRIRIGTYGDPAAVPAEIWSALMSGQSARTGYTHQWRTAAHLRGSVMASVGSADERETARAAGWRTFRVRRPDEPLLVGEIACPASAEGGRKTHCADCGLCDGARENDRRASIAIIDHGPTAKRRPLAALPTI